MEISGAGFALSELYEVVRRCNPCLGIMRPVCWRPVCRHLDRDVEASWALWVETFFRPILLPNFWLVLSHTHRQESREIVALDAELHLQLDSWQREQSLRAGHKLLHEMTPCGERILSRLQQAVQRGNAYGHFYTLFAVQCGIFSIPSRTAVMSLLLQEIILSVPSKAIQAQYLELAIDPVNNFLNGSLINSDKKQVHG